ncbi:MAG TPA: YciI family protein [Polyangiaceae bacterium]|nr:YciI family protein [Polyangiaceae bacterium]
MFIIELTYKVALEKIDAQMRPHMAFLNKHYDDGTFIISGRKIPRDGGIILAVGKTREELESIVREDPFVSLGLADYRIIEFRASQRAKDIPARVEG